MGKAFVENAEHNIDGDERGQNEPGLIGQRARKFGGIGREGANDCAGQTNVGFRLADFFHRFAE